ncbi:MAG: hypothetical protein IAF58_06855 [Leptolyngbya sp.]|nr:hypothetical protein [Candidatus Melainabacteria bacterium]
MTTISLIDLDDSIFQAARKCPVGIALSDAAVDKKGVAHSFCTPKQMALLGLLTGGGIVVPVTARETDGLKRVKIPFTSHAITSFGAVILTPEGSVEPGWDDVMRPLCQDATAVHLECLDFMTREARRLGIDSRSELITDVGMPLYVNTKHNDGNDFSELTKLRDALLGWMPDGWKIHFNANNLALLPPHLGKERAVTHYLRELAPDHSLVVGLGDSFTDLGFMGLCDFAITPTNSQIFAGFLSGITAPYKA